MTAEPTSAAEPRTGPLRNAVAVALVAGSSAAVLVLEILANRLLAPYVGVSLETYTGIIGTILAGIALGAAAGGALADRYDPRRLLPPLFVGGGGAAIATIPIIRALGPSVGVGGGVNILVLTALGFLPMAVILSAIPSAVVKLQLRDLHTTGATVGRLSGWSTGGAIVGTFLTGFVLVRWAAVTTLVVIVGLALVATGIVLWLGPARRRGPGTATSLGVVALSLVGVAASDSVCDVQTRYYCVSIQPDPDRPSARTLVLDDLSHSAVDLEDPTWLGFWYVRRMVDAIETLSPAGPLDVAYIGGGGLTLPRYLRATRPGSEQVVLEIDGDLVELLEERLGYEPGADVDIRIGDARTGLAALADDSADVVVGDAFGGRAVPWHLATEEFTRDVDRVLRPGGVYVLNMIDGPGLHFVRAEATTVAGVLPHVALLLSAGALSGGRGNVVLVASDRPFDPERLDVLRERAGDGGGLVAGTATDADPAGLAGFVGDAEGLTDDYAPVDQLLFAGA